MFSCLYDIKHFSKSQGRIDNIYSGYAYFADWHGSDCHFATNALVADFYQKTNTIGPYWYRHGRLDRFHRCEREISTISVDYYGLMGVCAGLLPMNWLHENANDIQNGEVKTLYYRHRDGVWFTKK